MKIHKVHLSKKNQLSSPALHHLDKNEVKPQVLLLEIQEERSENNYLGISISISKTRETQKMQPINLRLKN